MHPQSVTKRAIGLLGAAWGTIGVVGLLSFSVYRLTPRALEAFRQGLSTTQWAVAVGFLIFMAYSEGYRGFHLRFSPRTAARIRYLRDRPNLLHSFLAPFFSMGFFHAKRRTAITAYVLTLGIIGLVLMVRYLDQPWRGIIDAGVVFGLSLGLLSLMWWIVAAFTQSSFERSPEVPQRADTV